VSSLHPSSSADVGYGRGALTALRATSALTVVAILWQGVTAGAAMTQDDGSFALHAAGAVAVHVFAGLAVVAAFLLQRETPGPRRLLVLALAVFLSSFLQAALGNEATMWAHVPGALLLVLASGALLASVPRARGASR